MERTTQETKRRARRRRKVIFYLKRAIAAALLLYLIVALVSCLSTAVKGGQHDPKPVEPCTQEAEPVPVDPIAKPETTPETVPAATYEPDPEEVEMLAKLLWGEARGVASTTQKAAVVWCVLNRVDSDGYACGVSIEHVITFPHQFVGYDPSFPATAELKEIAEDVLIRWHAEKSGSTDVGRVLPKEFLFFTGDGKTNTFTTEWKGGTVWNWSLPSPYKN